MTHATAGLRTMTGMSLKGFLDVALLVKARKRKTRQLRWQDVAEEYGTTERHLHDVARRYVGRWPGGSSAREWMLLAGRFRDRFLPAAAA